MDKLHHSQNENKPLVSILIITYNSAKYVLETLESAKAQTYQNIELIITDDGSKDDTVEICRRWINEHSSRFIKSEVITVATNTGIPSNCNRGVLAAGGTWLKLIAGDDILDNQCVDILLNSAVKSDKKLFFANMNNFSETEVSKNEIDPAIYKFFEMNIESKLKQYSRHAYFLNSPTIFVHRETLNLLGLFNEKYKYLEDLPLIINFLKNKKDIGFVNESVVLRRVHNESISSQATSINEFRKEFLLNLYTVYLDLQRPNFKWYNIKDLYYRIMGDMNFSMYRKPHFLIVFIHSIIVKLVKIKHLLLKFLH